MTDLLESHSQSTGTAIRCQTEDFLNASLKSVVTSALKTVMAEKPDRALNVVASIIKAHSSNYRDDTFTVDLGAGLTCSLSNLNKKQHRSGHHRSNTLAPSTSSTTTATASATASTEFSPQTSSVATSGIMTPRGQSLTSGAAGGNANTVAPSQTIIVAPHPIYGLESPNATDMQKLLDFVCESNASRHKVHLVVELPIVSEELVFCLGNPYVTDLPQVLETKRNNVRRAGCGPSSPSGGDRLHISSPTTLQASGAAEMISVQPPSPVLSESDAIPPPQRDAAVKQLLQVLGRQRRAQSLSELLSTFKSKLPLNLIELPTFDPLGLLALDALDAAIGVKDNLENINPTIVVSFRRPKDSQLRRILANLVALYRPLEEYRVFQQLEIIRAAEKNVKVFAFSDHQRYWNEVLDRRDRRDKLREKREADRKQAQYDARVAIAKEAAAAAAVAAAAAAASGGAGPAGVTATTAAPASGATSVSQQSSMVPHPPGAPGGDKRRMGASGKDVFDPQTQLYLPPPPPPDPAQIEARRVALVARQNRRQQEDSEFVQILKDTRLQCVRRIQRIFRNWRARVRREMMDKELKELETKGGAGAELRPEMEAYREILKEPPYTGPALLRKAQLRLRDVHGALFSTLPPPPPLPPRRRRFYAPLRARIPPSYEDDVSSEDERWSESLVLVSDPNQSKRSMYFNPFMRLEKCYELAGCDLLQVTANIQSQFCGLSYLQKRAYRWITDSMFDVIHIAFIELAHRESLPTNITTFSQFVKSFHGEVLSWASAAHHVSLSTALCGAPVPTTVGPAHPMADRALYLSAEIPAFQPWQDTDSSNVASLNVAGGVKFLSRFSKFVYFTSDVMDRSKWISAVQHLADDDKHERIVWISLCEHPYLYSSGRPFVLARRPVRQRVDGSTKFLTVEAQVTGRLHAPATLNTANVKRGGGGAVTTTTTSSAQLTSPVRLSIHNSGARVLPPKHQSSIGSGASNATDTPRTSVNVSGVASGASPANPPALEVPAQGKAVVPLCPFAQFGVNMVEFENAVRHEILKQVEKSGQQVLTFLATETAAEAVTSPSSQQSPAFSAQPTTTTLDIVETGSHLGGGGDATPARTSMTLQSAEVAPITNAYFTDMISAVDVVSKEWSLLKPPRSDEGSAAVAAAVLGTRDPSSSQLKGTVTGDGSQVNGAAPSQPSGSLSSNAGNAAAAAAHSRALRKKVGSRMNLETASQRKSNAIDASFNHHSHNGGGGGPAGSIDLRDVGQMLTGGAVGESGTPTLAPILATPMMEARYVANQDSVNRFQLDFQRHAIRHCAGPQFLLAYDRFLSCVSRALVTRCATVIAMSGAQDIFFGASACLIDAVVEVAVVHSFQAGIAIETSFESGEDATISIVEASSQHDASSRRSTVRLRDSLPRTFMNVADVILKAASPAVRAEFHNDQETFIAAFDAALRRGNCSSIIAEQLMAYQILCHQHNSGSDSSQATIDDEARHMRSIVVSLCCSLEKLTWLLLLFAFLKETASTALQNSELSADWELPSFAAWASQPRFDAVHRWMEAIDPWAGLPPTASPDAWHVFYSNVHRRWDDGGFITIAV